MLQRTQIDKHTASKILDFWFSDELKAKWFAADVSFDRQITDRFKKTYDDLRKHYDDTSLWNIDQLPDDAETILALIIVLDQFPRNMFRGSRDAFATDAAALQLAQVAVDRKLDALLNEVQRGFLYMPFMHSERLEDQHRSVLLFQKLGNADGFHFAMRHKEIIERFGRFPHRNTILGRTSSNAEKDFLQQPGSSF